MNLIINATKDLYLVIYLEFMSKNIFLYGDKSFNIIEFESGYIFFIKFYLNIYFIDRNLNLKKI